MSTITDRRGRIFDAVPSRTAYPPTSHGPTVPGTAPDQGDDPVCPSNPPSGHWSPPDIPGVIPAEAWRPGVAEPVAIHVRPELHARLRSPGTPDHGTAHETIGIPVVIDQAIPAAPGYEIHRAGPQGHPCST